MKEKTNHKKENRPSCQSLCCLCGHCFDLIPSRNVDFIFENVSWREQMQTKTLCILHPDNNAEYKKDEFSRLCLYCTPAGTHLLCEHVFATYF